MSAHSSRTSRSPSRTGWQTLLQGTWTSSGLKQAGGDTTRLLEVDILRDQRHDMSKDDAMYAALLRIAMLLGWVDAVIGGPNCRTQSELRHHPVTGPPGPSRFVGRAWGLDELDEVEMAKCHLDDLLLFRMVTLYIVAKIGRNARLALREVNQSAHSGQVLDGTAGSSHMPEVASFWRTVPQSGLGHLQPGRLRWRGGQAYFTGT